MTGPIRNGNQTFLSQNPGTLPLVQDGLLNWFQELRVVRIEKEVNAAFQLSEESVEVPYQGLIQPLSPQALAIKPEGQREWKWFSLHCFPDLVLQNDDRVWIGGKVVQGPNSNGTFYRVLAKNDYAVYGYLEYHLVQDFQNEGVVT